MQAFNVRSRIKSVTGTGARCGLEQADGVIKLATVMLLKSLDRKAAEAALAAAGGNLRKALA